MSVTYRVHDAIVEMTLQGECPPEEVIQIFHEALNDPATPAKFALFLDVRQSTSLAKRSTAEIIRVAEHLGPYRDRVTRCAVLATEQVHFGLSRMGAVYSETAGVMTSVFRDRDEALAWLRGQNDDLQP